MDERVEAVFTANENYFQVETGSFIRHIALLALFIGYSRMLIRKSNRILCDFCIWYYRCKTSSNYDTSKEYSESCKVVNTRVTSIRRALEILFI